MTEQSTHLLDDGQEWQRFSRPLKSEVGAIQKWESNLVFQGMHCAACAINLENAIRKLPGIESVSINSASHRGSIIWHAGVALPSMWFEAIAKTGYSAVPAQDSFLRMARQSASRKMLWRLGVAGLCMMQVMMYAAPEYTAFGGDLNAEARQLLRIASWLISLPVLLYSCKPFFANAWRDILQRQISMDMPVALGMLISFVASSAGTFNMDGVFGAEVYFDSFTMLVFFLLLGRWLELRLRDRTAGALEALINRMPELHERMNEKGEFESVALRRLRLGDTLRVSPGQTFAVDGVVLAGRSQVDEALLTGEAKPQLKTEGALVIAGSHNLNGILLLRVTKLAEETRFAQMISLMERAASEKPQLVATVDKWAKPFLWLVLMVAAAACLWWWPTSPSGALAIAVSILVVSCPCALSLATPAAMLASAGALAKRGVLVQRLQALETLAQIQTFVFDKTGTLTQEGLRFHSAKIKENEDEKTIWSLACALALPSLHPLARALCQAQPAQDQVPQELAQELALEVVEVSGAGMQSGAYKLGSAKFCGIAVADTDMLQTHLVDANGWLASFYFEEDVRADAQVSLAQLGGTQHILSGDSAPAVARVAEKLGITSYQSGLEPEQKLAALRNLQREGRWAAMVGDGINDGPVLAGAAASFALGNALPLTQARADFVLMGGKLALLPMTLHHAQKTMRVVKQNLYWAATYNLIMLPLAVLGDLTAWQAGLGMAVSSLTVVLNALRLSKIEENPSK